MNIFRTFRMAALLAGRNGLLPKDGFKVVKVVINFLSVPKTFLATMDTFQTEHFFQGVCGLRKQARSFAKNVRTIRSSFD